MATIIIQEWAYQADRTHFGPAVSLSSHPGAATLIPILIKLIESPPRSTYTEMTTLLRRIQADCQALLSAFGTEGRLVKKLIPTLPKKVDAAASTSPDVFTLATAQSAATTQFDSLFGQLGKSAAKSAGPGLQDRQRKVIVSIGYYAVMKDRYDTQVAAGVAGALVALRVLPAKFGGLIKAIMDSIKVSSMVPVLHIVRIGRKLTSPERRINDPPNPIRTLHLRIHRLLLLAPIRPPRQSIHQGRLQPLHLSVFRYIYHARFPRRVCCGWD